MPRLGPPSAIVLWLQDRAPHGMTLEEIATTADLIQRYVADLEREVLELADVIVEQLNDTPANRRRAMVLRGKIATLRASS